MSAKTAKFQESFVSLTSIEHVVGEPWEVKESALEATNPVWEPQFAGRLTEAEIGLRNAVKGPASWLIFQPQISHKVAKKTVQLGQDSNHQHVLVDVLACRREK